MVFGGVIYLNNSNRSTASTVGHGPILGDANHITLKSRCTDLLPTVWCANRKAARLAKYRSVSGER